MSFKCLSINIKWRESRKTPKRATPAYITHNPSNVVMCNMLATCSESQLTWALPDQGERKFHQKDTLLWLFFCPYKPSQTSPVGRLSSWDPDSSRASQVKQQGTHHQPERNTWRGAVGKPMGVISHHEEQLRKRAAASSFTGPSEHDPMHEGGWGTDYCGKGCIRKGCSKSLCWQKW